MNFFDKIWTEKYRPTTVEDMVLNSETKEFFTNLTDIPNLLFYGKPGSGKTTMAKILANKLAPESHIYINASETNGIDMIRNEIKTFVSTRSFDGSKKIVILDEADGLSSASTGSGSSAQGALRNIMEEYLDTVRFILTANYPNKIIKPLLSRCNHFEFTFDWTDVGRHLVKIMKLEGIKYTKEDQNGLKKLIKNNFPDIRRCISQLQMACKTKEFVYVESSENNEFGKELYEMIKDTSNGEQQCFAIRQKYLDNEDRFNNDYHALMRQLFDIYVAKMDGIRPILHITAHMEKHSQVMDVEVNFFALIVKLVTDGK